MSLFPFLQIGVRDVKEATLDQVTSYISSSGNDLSITIESCAIDFMIGGTLLTKVCLFKIIFLIRSRALYYLVALDHDIPIKAVFGYYILSR